MCIDTVETRTSSGTDIDFDEKIIRSVIGDEKHVLYEMNVSRERKKKKYTYIYRSQKNNYKLFL